MSSTLEMRDAVTLAQQCNINLYRYLINGLVDNSLMVSQLKVEFEDYTRSSMRFFNQLTHIRDTKIPIVRLQEEQNNVLIEEVKRNDQLRQQIHVIRVRGEMGQQIPMVDPNMIAQDFPELCVSRCPSDIPITVLCELIIRKYNVHNDSSIKTMLKRIEEESISMEISDPEPIVPSQEVTSITPTMVDMQPIEPSTDIHDVTSDLSFPLTTCALDDMFDVTTSTQSTALPNNEDDGLDELLSVLANIPELDTEYHPLDNKKSPCAVSGPVSTTSKLSTTNSSLLAAPKKKQEVKRDYKEYPEYTPRTSPALSWDQLIERFQKLDNSNGASKQDQTTVTAKEESTSVQEASKVIPGAVNTKVPQEAANTNPHENQIKPSALPKGTHLPMVATKRLQSDIVSEILSVYENKKRRQHAPKNLNNLTPAELVKRKQELSVLELLKLNTQKVLNDQEPTPMVATTSLQSNVVSESPSVNKKRRQHAPKHPSNNLTTAESLNRKEQLAALQLKKLKTQKVLNDQFKKSWEGKAFLNKIQNVHKAEVTKKATPTVPPKYQPTAQVVNQSAARNVIQSGIGVINQSTFRVGYQAAYRNVNQSAVRAVNQPVARVVNESAARPVNQPAASKPSRKRPASSSVDTPSQAKRRARHQPRIILKIFREHSDWNVEQIVDRY